MAANALTLARIARGRTARTERHRGRYLRPLPPQLAWWRDPSRCKLLRIGNQWCGKTTAGVIEVDWRCTGSHPYLSTPPPPVEIWIVCASWSQSVVIQQKHWENANKAELHPSTVFSSAGGYRGKHPYVRYKNGSIVRFKTTNQGGLRLASATIDAVLVDEPTSQRIFEELRKRLIRRAGTLMMTLTPINGPVDYLRELAEKGQVSDHHYPLRPELLIPVGASRPLCLSDGTPMDAEWCAQLRRETMEMEAPVTIDGEWEVRSHGRVFSAFDQRQGGRHICEELPTADLSLCLGIDHGQHRFKQCAVLVGLDLSGEHPRVHVLDEYVAEADQLPADDASAIIEMLRRNGLRWSDLSEARGDRKYAGAEKRLRLIRKSNKELAAAIRKQLGAPKTALRPPIRQAKKGAGGGAGSVLAGCRWLHRAMVRPRHFSIHPRCERLVESLQRWEYRDDDWKDTIDALRYSTWSHAIRGRRISVRPRIDVE